MARQPGSANFSGTIEALAGGPLDARSIVKTKADLTAVGSFEYPYIGMETYVVSENKKYRLIGDNPLVVANWEEIGSVILDEEIDETSENGVQNKAIAEALNEKQNTLSEGDGIIIENDEISVDEMPAEDMDEVIDELPTGGNIAVTGYVPLGTLISFYGQTAPKFFLACDGSAYNKADYPELANHLLSLTNNTPYIVDGDDTKFKVPDLRGEFIRGTGSNSHANQGSGAEVGTHQDATVIPGYALTSNLNTLYYGYDDYSDIQTKNADSHVSSSTTTKRVNATVSSATTSTAARPYTARPTNTSVLFCIAYKDIYSNPMNDYSTTEKVVGTWIDGKPIYQKTILCTTPTVATDGIPVESTTAHGVANLHQRVSMNIHDGMSGGTGLIGGISASNIGYLTGYFKADGIILRSTRTLWNNIQYWVTIQYTKTTD